jgi:hypothetical protein
MLLNHFSKDTSKLECVERESILARQRGCFKSLRKSILMATYDEGSTLALELLVIKGAHW